LTQNEKKNNYLCLTLTAFFCFGLFSVFVFLVFKVDSRETFNKKIRIPAPMGKAQHRFSL